jgi:hypothetical protein
MVGFSLTAVSTVGPYSGKWNVTEALTWDVSESLPSVFREIRRRPRADLISVDSAPELMPLMTPEALLGLVPEGNLILVTDVLVRELPRLPRAAFCLNPSSTVHTVKTIMVEMSRIIHGHRTCETLIVTHRN